MQHYSRARGILAALSLATAAGVTACTDPTPTAVSAPEESAPRMQLAVPCTASLTSREVSCGMLSAPGVSANVIGGQNVYVKLTSSNVSYDSGTGIFQFDVTVQNLMNEAIGTPDGTVPDPEGIQVFFHSGPTVTAGSGAISVANPDGVGTFSRSNQPYFQYNQILAKNAISAAKTWKLNVAPTVTSFHFTVYLETDVQYLLVINEMLTNPGGIILDTNGEWVEIYNAGSLPVQMQGLVIADSAASGRRPFHLIGTPLLVEPGGYVTLGNTTDTTLNGGVPIDYVYGSAMAFTNSVDAFKISRVVGTDTVTIDRTQYATGAVSAQNGISRELKNPALDNSNMDGSNWADASVTSVYGPGGRGTPKAQNSTFTP